MSFEQTKERLFRLCFQDDSEESVSVSESFVFKLRAISDGLGESFDDIDQKISIPGATRGDILLARTYADLDDRDPSNQKGGKYTLSVWEIDFFSDISSAEILCSLIEASNALEYRRLLSAGGEYLALNIQGKTPPEIRAFLQLPDDLEAEKKQEIKERYGWVESN